MPTRRRPHASMRRAVRPSFAIAVQRSRTSKPSRPTRPGSTARPEAATPPARTPADAGSRIDSLCPARVSLDRSAYAPSPASLLGPDAVDHSRKRNRLANVLDAAHPRGAAFDAHPKTAVRHAAVARSEERRVG